MKHVACCVKDCHLPATLTELACPMHLAAPELLEAAKWLITHDVLNDVDMPKELRDEVAAMRRIIAKAEGK